MRIGSKSQDEFFLKLNKKNTVIQDEFLKKIIDIIVILNKI